MVIIASKEGQLANRIWHASYFMANAYENGYKVYHLHFYDYYQYFSESLSRSPFNIRFVGKRTFRWSRFVRELLRNFLKVLLKLGLRDLAFMEIIRYDSDRYDGKPYEINNSEFIRKAKRKIVFILGWYFEDQENIQKHKNLMLKTWRPNEEYTDEVERLYARYKKNHDLLIGVHIRRGDYKNFNGGKWFYDTEDYYHKITEMAGMPEFAGKRLAFIVCSNETVSGYADGENFSVFCESRHMIVDIFLLARCDYILGPPSTFSIFASFYGSVPTYLIADIKERFAHKEFVLYPIWLKNA